MKKVFLVLIIALILNLFVGCTSSNTNISEETKTQSTSEKEPKNATDLIKVFEKAFPKAEIVNKTMSDLDNDNEEDLVIIFNNPTGPTETTRSNICVVTNYSTNALDLAGGDLNYQFAKGPDSLKILQNPKRASIILHDIKTNKNIDYQVTMTFDKEIKKSNFKIKTVEQPTN